MDEVGNADDIEILEEVINIDPYDDADCIILPSGLQEQTTNDVEVVQEEECFNCYPKKDLLTIIHHKDLLHKDPIVGTAFIGEIDVELKHGAIILHKSGVIEENGEILIFKLCTSKKTSPWKGMKQYSNVSVLGRITRDLLFASIREVYIPDILQFGFSFSWLIEDKNRLIFNLHLKNSNIYRNINYVDLNKTAKCFEDHRSSFHLWKRPNAIVSNFLLSLFRPEFQEALTAHQPTPLMHDAQKREDLENFYGLVRDARSIPPSYKLRLDSLACSLRPYQRDAVNFMLHRELEPGVDVGNVYEALQLHDDMFYFPSLGAFVRDASGADVRREVCGGILADEMGLGKTVELLSLILTNTCEQDSQDLIRNRNNELDFMQQKPCCSTDSDMTEIEDTLLQLVSKVSAVCDGEEGLKAMKKAKSQNSRTKRRNTVYNLDSYVHQTYSTRPCDDRIECTECGITTSRKEMHWLPEFDEQKLDFTCPACVTQGPIIPISATLIVVPQAIYHQWFEEIKRHVKENVKIDMYMGLTAEGYKHPQYLNTFNIVITTYEILKQEFAFMTAQKENFETKLRKRSYAMPRNVTTPLLYIRWWRVCLDESQLVENTQSRVVEMCWNLETRARWCVTGTPLISSCGDFFSLLSFLHVPPFHSKDVWDSLIFNPYYSNNDYKPILSLMKQLFWRNSKKDVENQLDLPPITETVVEVILTPLELEFYKDKVADSRVKITDCLRRVPFALDDQFIINNLPDHILKLLQTMFNDIRLALVTGDCSLPEMNRRLRPRHHLRGTKIDAPFTPEALFKNIVQRCKKALEESTREAIFSLFGMANRSRRFTKIREAHGYYQKVLRYISELDSLNTDLGTKLQVLFDKEATKDVFKVDTTQAIHAYRNLIKLHEDFPRLVHIDADQLACYKLCYKDACERFTQNSTDGFKKVCSEYIENVEQYRKNKDLFNHGISSTLIVLDRMEQKNVDELVKQFYRLKPKPLTAFYPRWHLIWNELEYMISNRQKTLEKFLQDFEQWTNDDTGFANSNSEVFKETMVCPHNEHYLEKEKKKPNEEEDSEDDKPKLFDKTAVWMRYFCPMCLMRQSMLELEKLLSITALEEKSRKAGARRQLAQLENQEVVLKDRAITSDPLYQAILAIRNQASRNQKTATSEAHDYLMKWFEACRKIMTGAQATINAVQELVFRHREIAQAATATTVADEEFLAAKLNFFPLFSPENFEQAFDAQIREEYARAEQQRKQAIGRISYIHGLQDGLTSDSESRECPVCYDALDRRWMVLPCIHAICLECYTRFIQLEPANRGPLRCVTCRAVYHREEVHMVQKQTQMPGTEGHRFDFRGMQMTFKFDAVMRKIVDVLNEDRTNKIIVFSSMLNALSMLSGIMHFIDMPHTMFATTNNLEKLATFKHDADVNVLLLPLSFGANGLNLVEANHVFFLEPIPDTSVFQQAVGRVYRMGQNRACTIHHFVTKDTIEESIYSVSSNGSDREGLTYGSFKQILGLNPRNNGQT